MIFPVWLLIWLLPTAWVIVLPANFIVDSLVLVIAMKLLKIENIFENTREVILKVWLFGFLADFIGTVAILMAILIDSDTAIGKWWYINIANPVGYYPFKSIYAMIYVAACVAISGYFIYIFNFRICLNKLNISDKHKKKLALSLAIFTAPYSFYLPATWFY